MADETKNAFVEYGIKAREEHVKFIESVLPGFVAFELDIDVSLSFWKKTMHAGTYFLLADDMTDGEKMQLAPIYTVNIDPVQLMEEAERAGYEETVLEDGTTVRSVTDNVSMNFKVEPIEVEEGRRLAFFEMLAWLAMTVAETDEIRKDIFSAAYHVEKKSADATEGLPKQDEVKPSWRHDPITKLAQSLSDPALYGEFGTTQLNVAWPNEKKKDADVLTAVALEYIGDDKDIKLSRPVSEFDILVLNGYIAQVAGGRSMFTAADVYEAVTGGGTPNKKQLAEYTESIDRMRFNKLTVDMTQEAEAHNLVDPETGKPWKSWKVETMLLPADKITMQAANGRIVEGYVSTREPVVYTHARMTNQIVSYPMKYLDTRDAGSNTKQNNIIKTYLLRRILQARDNPRMRPTIKYSTVYEKADINSGNKTTRKRVNDYIESLMKEWVKMGLIKGYTIGKEGRQIAKVTVTFPK